MCPGASPAARTATSKLATPRWRACHDNIIYNRHELPPGGISIDIDIESDEIKINSDIYICMFKNDILCDYTISQYGELVYIMNEQYEFESDGDSINDDDLKLDDFNKINIDSILKIDTNINNTTDILDYDLNVY